MSYQTVLDSLHSSISKETAKLLKWEVETAVNIRDREGQIQQTAGVTSTQEQLIPQLEQENTELRGALGAAKHEREEILRKTSFAIREVEVLTSQFMELQGEMEKLRQEDTPGSEDFGGEEMADLIASTKSLRLAAASSKEEVRQEMKILQDKRKEEEDNEVLALQGAQQKIDLMREEVKEKEIVAMEMENKLHDVFIINEEKKKALVEAMLTLQEQNAKNVALNEDISKMEEEANSKFSEFESTLEKMNCQAMLKAEELENAKAMVVKQEDALKKLLEEKKIKLAEKAAKDETLMKLEGENGILAEKLSLVVVEVEQLAKSVEEEEKVEKDLDMLRADLRVCEENRKLLETEVVATRRVEQQKIGLEKENKNMKSRAELLIEKEASYCEDLIIYKKQLEEITSTEKNAVEKLKALEKDNLELDSEIKALGIIAEKEIDQRKLTDADNLVLEEKVRAATVEMKNLEKIQAELEEEEAALLREYSRVKAELEGSEASIKAAELGNKAKMEEVDVFKTKRIEETERVTSLQSTLREKHDMKQSLVNKHQELELEEGRIVELQKGKQNECHAKKEELKLLEENILVQEKDGLVLANENSGLADTLAAKKSELEKKRVQVVGIDVELSMEMDNVSKKYEECKAELEVVRKLVLETTAVEEEFVRDLDELEKKTKLKKIELSEKLKQEDEFARQKTVVSKENQEIEKEIKAIDKEMSSKQLKLEADKKAIDDLKKKTNEYERKSKEIVDQIEELKVKKQADLEEYRVGLDQKVTKHGKAMEEIEIRKGGVRRDIEEIESKLEQFELDNKTKKAKKKLEKIEKLKDMTEEKEQALKEKNLLDVAVNKCKVEIEFQTSLVKNLVAEIKKSADDNIEMIEVDSDDENVATRKVVSRSPSASTPRRNRSLITMPSSNKRKLEESATKGEGSKRDIYQFADSSDSEGQSQPKFLVPSTPRGRNIFKKGTMSSTNFTPTSKKQVMLPMPSQPRSVSFTPPTPRSLAKPDMKPVTANSKKVKVKDMKQVSPVNFDDVMAVSSDLDSN